MSFYFFLSFFLTVFSFAESKDPKPEMRGLAMEISILQKFLFSEAQFQAAENQKSIEQSLDTMNKHLKGLEGKTEDPVLQTNLGLITRHMKDATRSFKEGNKPYARYMLQSSLQMCIACHTRKKVEWDFAIPDENLSGTDLEKADFYFATRQFEKGKEAFESVIKKYPDNKVGGYGLRKALLSLAVFYARVKEDPSGGAKFFSQFEKKGALPVYLQKEAIAWAKDFESWSKEKSKGPKDASESELLRNAQSLLLSDDFSLVGDSDRRFHIKRLRATSLLHKLLELKGGKTPSKGRALYLLGQIYHRINHHLFFRFGELYLKACVQEYQKTKLAQDCYLALEQSVMEGYSGSAGLSVPEDEEVELMQLKRLAF